MWCCIAYVKDLGYNMPITTWLHFCLTIHNKKKLTTIYNKFPL